MFPSATREDLIAATGDERAAATLSEFARSSPFVRVGDNGTFVVHPLMRAMLVENQLARRDALLARAADAFDAAGGHLRAAELHLARSDHEAAARSLELVPVGDYRAPEMRYSRMVSSLDRSIVRRYPTLWCCSALLQTFSIESEQLLEETVQLWASLPPDTPLHTRYYVLATHALLLTYLGRFDEALATIDAAAPRDAIPEVPTLREHGYVVYLRGTILGRMGRIEEAERELRAGWPLVESMDAMASAALVIAATEIESVRGNVERERELLSRSLDYARNAELSNFESFRLAELVVTCWLQADESGYARYADELERVVERHGIRGFRFFTACVGRRASEPAGPDLIRWIVWGHILAAGNGDASEAALLHARAARDAARNYPNPYLCALASLTVAELGTGAERAAAYAEARAFAARSGSDTFAKAVSLVAARDDTPTMLSPFLHRLRTRRPSSPVPRLEVSVLTGSVRVRGKLAKLGDRELELVLALARRRRASSRDELVAMLWPDRDDEAAANSLKVYVHRARQHLGDDGAIERTRDGLRLCEEAIVDIWEIERAVADRRSCEIGDDDDCSAVRALYERLGAERPSRFSAWEWFDRVERRVQELRCELGQRLARYALARGRTQETLRVADEMIAYDACHEVAHELSIVAHLTEGNRAAALLRYRRYRDVLLAELQCDPSPSISALLEI